MREKERERERESEEIKKKYYPKFNLLNLLGSKNIKLLVKIINIFFYGRFDSYLNNVKGVIHIGASDGYERNMYKKYKVCKVVWIEADPNIFVDLQKNIKTFKNQEAYNYLLTDVDNKKYKFNITKDNGQSSSILNMKKLYLKMYPSAKIKKKIILKSSTFETFIKKKFIKLNYYNALTIDTQGSELLILKGMKNLINKFDIIKVEASEFRIYENYPILNELTYFMNNKNFREIRRIETDEDFFGRKTYDILFIKNKTKYKKYYNM